MRTGKQYNLLDDSINYTSLRCPLTFAMPASCHTQAGAQSGVSTGKQYDLLLDDSIDFIKSAMLKGEGDLEPETPAVSVVVVGFLGPQ